MTKSDSLKNSSLSDLKLKFSTLKEEFVQEGHFELESNLKRVNDTIYIGEFNLGKKYEILKLEVPKISQLRAIVQKAKVPIIKDSIILKTAFAKAYLENLTSIASNSGLPLSEFVITNIKKSSADQLTGRLEFSNPKERTIDRLIIKDYNTLRSPFIKYKANLNIGDIFNRQKLSEQSKILGSLPFTRQTKEPDVLFTSDSTKVYFYLSKRNANQFDGLLSFNREESGKFNINGFAELALINNFNYGESIFIKYRADGNDQSQLSAKLNIPYIFNLPIGFESELQLFRKDSSFSNTETNYKLQYDNNVNSRVSLGIQSIQSDNLSGSSNDSISNFTKNSFTIGYAYQKGQESSLFPTKSYFKSEFSSGNRKTKTISERQYSADLNTGHHFRINDKTQILLTNQTKYLFSPKYLTNELFVFGGIDNTRGFDQNSFFANWFTVFQSEYQFILNPSLYIHTITDVGFYENKLTDTNSYLTTLGLGAGIDTRSGILKISLVNGKVENHPILINRMQLLVSLVARF